MARISFTALFYIIQLILSEPCESNNHVTTRRFGSLKNRIIVGDLFDIRFCSELGVFPVKDTGCTTYLNCTENNEEGLRTEELTCNSTSLFDQDLKKCSEDYTCSEISKVVEFDDKCIPENTTFECTEAGFFPAFNTNCTKYTWCKKIYSGYKAIIKPCYSGTLFNPSLGKCTADYICKEIPCNSNTTILPPIDLPICTESGKLPIPNTGCRKFRICSATSNGIVHKDYDCPSNSYFDPHIAKCSTLYICPEPLDSTTVSTTTGTTTEPDEPVCTSTGSIPLPNTECKSYRLCIETTNGFLHKDYNCSSGFFDPHKQNCSISYICPDTNPGLSSTTEITAGSSSTDISTTSDPPNNNSTLIDSTTTDTTVAKPVCKEQGKFSVPNTDCKIYLQCILTTNGFLEKIYECSKGLLFDPTAKICSSTYICSDTETTTSTTEKIPPSPVIPTCTSLGNFPVPNTNCRNYLSCILTTNGFIATEYSCPSGKLFNPILQRCTGTYNCAENIRNTNLLLSTDIPVCTKNGKFLIPNSQCTQYVFCVKKLSGFHWKIYTCPKDTYFDPSTNRCSKVYVCPELTSRTTRGTEIEIPDCKVDGKFPIENTACISYILCISTSTIIKSKVYSCPSGTAFNPNTKRCQVGYKCKELIPTETIEFTTVEMTTETSDLNIKDFSSSSVGTIIPDSSISVELTTKEITLNTSNTNTLDNNNSIVVPECYKEGKFVVQRTNCNQYFLCVNTTQGFRSKVYICPSDSKFNSNTSKCTLDYQCQESITSTEHPIITSKPQYAQCNKQGKFPIPNSNCKKFSLCVSTSAGFVSASYMCPMNSFFDPYLNRCSENYVCLENDNRILKTNVRICPKIGNYSDLADPNCEYYYNCKANSATRNKCKNGSKFDPEKERCSASYICSNSLTPRKRIMRDIDNVVSPTFLLNGQCTTVGRYLVTGTNCKNYVYCYANADGTLTATQFTCPTTTVFNQVIQKCTTGYVCPDNVCFFPGTVPNPNSKDCSSYIMCQMITNPITGVITGYSGVIVYCPAGTKYDPFGMFCSNIYVCPT